LEGDNIFDKMLIASQRTSIKLGLGPKEMIGNLKFKYKGNVHKDEEIEGIVFNEDKNGKVHIIELPQEMENGAIAKNLYVAGIDGIDLG